VLHESTVTERTFNLFDDFVNGISILQTAAAIEVLAVEDDDCIDWLKFIFHTLPIQDRQLFIGEPTNLDQWRGLTSLDKLECLSDFLQTICKQWQWCNSADRIRSAHRLLEAGAGVVGGDGGVDIEGQGEGPSASSGGNAGGRSRLRGLEEVFDFEAERFGAREVELFKVEAGGGVRGGDGGRGTVAVGDLLGEGGVDGDLELQEIATTAGYDDGGYSAEEQAVHVTEDPPGLT